MWPPEYLRRWQEDRMSCGRAAPYYDCRTTPHPGKSARMGRIRRGNNLDRPCREEHLPGRIIDQVICVDAAQASGEIPPRGCAVRRLIRVGCDRGSDDGLALCVLSTAARERADGIARVAFTGKDHGHTRHRSAGNGGRASCAVAARVDRNAFRREVRAIV